MKDRKKRSLFDEFFGSSLFEDIDKIFEDMREGKEVESGYSISVTQTPQGTKVHVRAGKGVDVNTLRRQLERQYPNAQIEIEGGRPLIREISTKPIIEEDKDEGGR